MLPGAVAIDLLGIAKPHVPENVAPQDQGDAAQIVWKSWAPHRTRLPVPLFYWRTGDRAHWGIGHSRQFAIAFRLRPATGQQVE